MPASNDKASKFLEAINKYAEEQKNEIQNEAEEFKRKELEKAEKEVLNDAYKLIQKEMAEMKKKITSDLSVEELKGKKNLFELRNNIMTDVFNRALDKLVEFTKTEEYQLLLERYLKTILNILNEEGTHIYARKEDIPCLLKAKEGINMNFSIDEFNDIKIGGIYGYNNNMGLVVDETLDLKLKEQYEWFRENSGLTIV